MLHYSAIKSQLYVETTLISYLVARPSNDTTLAYRQQFTRRLWEECANDYEFVIEGTQMKEKVDTRTDAILEECYRMKEEFNAQFNSVQELSDYLKAENKKRKALGWKYVAVPRMSDNCHEKN